MKKRVYFFNLIEIVLTVAVITFGVVVILGMLPKGLQATRNAGMENYVTDIIDQMATYIINNTDVQSKIKEYDKNLDLSDFDGLDHLKLLSQSEGGFNQVNAYDVSNHTTHDNLYVIVRGDTHTVDGEPEIRTDFTGMLRVWKSPSKYNVLKTTHKGTDKEKLHDCAAVPADAADEECEFSWEEVDVPEDRAIQINMELSYPLSLPYKERSKRYYSFEVRK